MSGRLVKHYINYQTGEFKMMDEEEHKALHRRLRKEGRCKVPYRELHRISHNRHQMDDIFGITDRTYVAPNVCLREDWRFNKITGSMWFLSRFEAHNGTKLLVIDIDGTTSDAQGAQ